MRITKPIFLIIGILTLISSGVAAHHDPPRSAAPNPPRAKVDVESPSTPRAVTAPTAPTTEWTLHKTADGLHPDDNEQAMMWLMNRARSDPAQEGVWLATTDIPDIASGRSYFGVDIDMLQAEFASYDAKPPAAFDARLYNAAKAHSEYLISIDEQNHDGQFDRISDAGFSYGGGSGYSARGSVFVWADSALNAHGAFNIDWGGSDGGMQESRGHRKAIMSIDGDYTNVGYAMVAENDPQTSVGPLVTTGNYCHANESQSDHYNVFIVGTVWRDSDEDELYDPGEGIGGVTVMPDSGDYYAVTGDSGGYAIPILADGEYLVTFSGPASGQGTVTVSGESELLDLVMGPTYTISGRVTDASGSPIADVLITANSGQNVTTDANGDYTLTGLEAGTYTLTPSKPEMTFTPTSLEVIVADGDITGQDFVGQMLYNIMGRVEDGVGAGLAGVTISADGTQTTTDASGVYTFTDVPAGTYTIKPEMGGYVFDPATRSVEVVDQDLTDVDFIAMRVYTVSGEIRDSDSMPIVGVTVQVDAQHVGVTGGSGAYAITNLVSGDYALTPKKSGFAFVPATRQVQVVDTDLTNQDFSVVDLRLSPGQVQVGEPGNTLVYNHTLTNTDELTHSYTISVSNDHDWPVSLFSDSAPEGASTLLVADVGPDMQGSFGISVTIPASITLGTTANTHITATSTTSATTRVALTDATVIECHVFLPLIVRN